MNKKTTKNVIPDSASPSRSLWRSGDRGSSPLDSRLCGNDAISKPFSGILSKEQILERVKKGDLSFTPSLDIFQPQVDAVDLRLGFTFQVPK